MRRLMRPAAFAGVSIAAIAAIVGFVLAGRLSPERLSLNDFGGWLDLATLYLPPARHLRAILPAGVARRCSGHSRCEHRTRGAPTVARSVPSTASRKLLPCTCCGADAIARSRGARCLRRVWRGASSPACACGGGARRRGAGRCIGERRQEAVPLRRESPRPRGGDVHRVATGCEVAPQPFSEGSHEIAERWLAGERFEQLRRCRR